MNPSNRWYCVCVESLLRDVFTLVDPITGQNSLTSSPSSLSCQLVHSTKQQSNEYVKTHRILNESLNTCKRAFLANTSVHAASHRSRLGMNIRITCWFQQNSWTRNQNWRFEEYFNSPKIRRGIISWQQVLLTVITCWVVVSRNATASGIIAVTPNPFSLLPMRLFRNGRQKTQLCWFLRHETLDILASLPLQDDSFFSDGGAKLDMRVGKLRVAKLHLCSRTRDVLYQPLINSFRTADLSHYQEIESLLAWARILWCDIEY